MKHVTAIRHNLKGGGSAEIGRRTLVLGPNGAGKSALVNAVELALTGKASDLQGRDLVAQNAALATLSTDRVVWSEVTLSDGATSRWEIEGTGRPSRTGPEGIFPLREVTTGLTGSADRARKFLLRYVCDGITEETVAEALPKALRGKYSAACNTERSPVENLQHITSRAAQRAGELGRDANAAKARADESGWGLGPEPSDDEVAALDAALVAAEEHYIQARQTLAVALAYQPPVTTLEELDAEIDALDGAVAAAIESRGPGHDTASPEQAKARTQAQFRETAIRALAYTEGLAACFLCGSAHGRETTDHHEALVGKLVAAQERARVRNLAQAEQRNRDSQLEATILRGEGRVAQLRAQRDALAQFPPPPAVSEAQARPLVDEADRARAAARAASKAAHDALAGWTAARADRTAYRDAEGESEAWQALALACRRVTDNLVQDAIGRFTSRVQRFLPSTDEFSLAITKTTCKLGLVRDGARHSALSGAEWARVMAAISCACTPEGAELPVLVPEDRAWDSRTLRSVLQGLSNYPGQVIVATTTKPWRGAPKGWETIELEKAQ